MFEQAGAQITGCEFDSSVASKQSSPVAINKLSSLLATAKLNRLLERMRSPRRLGLTVLASVLGIVWLSQAIFGVIYRASAPAEKLLVWIPLSLSVYFIWNLVKAAGQKPIEPFEWSETEREWLLSAPLPRQDVIAFRSSTIARAALVKSLIFAFVMIPDLKILPLGFLGILGALLFIDLLRLIVEVVVWGLTNTERMLFRVFVFGAGAIVVARALLTSVYSEQFVAAAGSGASFGFLLQFFNELCSQANAWYGKLLLLPFNTFASIMVADTIDMGLVAKLLVVGAVILSLTKVLISLDDFFGMRRIAIERAELDSANSRTATETLVVSNKTAIKPPSWQGIGGLAWRQWLGVCELRWPTAVSLFIPALFSCMPALAGGTGFALVANTVGALAFYSLVLLPAALKFDFRRDVDRLTMLKALPVTPLRTAVGQLVVPIILASLFQLFSLLLVMAMEPYSPWYLFGGMLFLLPFNVFIFSFENLVFLWYPHRIRQEGMQVLLRSILAFTAKSLIFGLAFAGSFIWVLMAKWISESLNSGWLTTANVFAVGLLLIASSVAAVAFGMLVKAFERFDPSSDLAAVD